MQDAYIWHLLGIIVLKHQRIITTSVRTRQWWHTELLREAIRATRVTLMPSRLQANAAAGALHIVKLCIPFP
jgi:hypothetical protein